MKKYWKPILTLLLVLPFLTEILVGMPVTVILNPLLYLLLITVGYGFPVLVIREIAVRKQIGLLGLFILGVIYGLHNEGLMARTIFAGYHSPIDTFASYGLINGIRLPWALTITFWHALHAVIYPIIFVHYLFPDSAREPWLSKKIAWALGIITFVAGFVVFFSGPPENPRGTISHFVFMLVVGAALWLVAKYFKAPLQVLIEAKQNYSLKTIWKGVLLYTIFFMVPVILSKSHASAELFFLYFLVITIMAIIKLRKIVSIPLQEMVLIGSSGVICVSLFSIVLTLPLGLFLQSLTSLIITILFINVIRKVRTVKLQNTEPKN